MADTELNTILARAKHQVSSGWLLGGEASYPGVTFSGVTRFGIAGQLPCIVTGDFAVGDHIVARQDGDRIIAVAVPDDAISFAPPFLPNLPDIAGPMHIG